MELHSHILPSNYPLQSLHDHNDFSRPRQPLSDAAGNSRSHATTPTDVYNDNKSYGGPDRLLSSVPTLPSQPAQHSLALTLDYRRQSHRKRRKQRINRNPIADSPQYIAYRERAGREGNTDQIWPDVLEDAFLNALLEVPQMGRSKFIFNSKQHGRNELISRYLWIAYVESLKSGKRPDKEMERSRKQVSSHIQVIKNLFRGHPLFFVLFPVQKKPKNGFEVSYKNDPCLIALSQGRLPTRHHQNQRYKYEPNPHKVSMRPALFWLLITTQTVPEDHDGRYNTEEDLYDARIVAHKFSGLAEESSRCNLDDIVDWRHKFPSLARLGVSEVRDCKIIHMDVSLDLMTDYPPEGSELCCRTEMSLSGRRDYDNHEWRIITTFKKPPELWSDPSEDQPMEVNVGVIGDDDDEPKIKVPFPARAWANAFTQLVNVQSRYEERCRARAVGATSAPLQKSVREYVEELSMYQEVRSSLGPGIPFVTRAIILWTFDKARAGEDGRTNWRYVEYSESDILPRRLCMSPSPHMNHQISASMNETFNSWAEPMNLGSNILDPFNQGLVTPPQTAGLNYPQYYPYNGTYDLPANLSFVSNKTADSDSTLVENDSGSQMDRLLSNSATQLTDYETQSNNWPPLAESFDTDPAWSFNAPASTPHLTWPETELKPTSWAGEADARNEWHPEPTFSPFKHINAIEQTIEQRLAPWVEQHDETIREEKDGFEDLSKEEMVRADGITTGDDAEWNDQHNEFDYAALADRLK